ncbi:MAG: acyl-CoA dehydrogenase [Acidimicrobiales bacterium]|jgi:alkylation response protein AidB-like acyl-CoA dehydrogenase
MTVYAAPLADIEFAMGLVGLDELSKLSGFEHSDLATVRDLLSEFGRFVAEQIAPLNTVSDEVGSNFDPAVGHVVTPDGFKQAYERYIEAGWSTVTFDPEHGGGGFPGLVGASLVEMLVSGCFGFAMCPGLTHSAADLLARFGTEEQKQKFLPKMVPGVWTGTMDLTEPDAGSDLAQVRTMAKPCDDGTWRVSGSKIFISWGDHDMAENIVHLVLARTPDAPAGTRGISLFVVPSRLVGPDGGAGAPNAVSCASTEHKLGIRGSATCTMAFDDAQGELVGELHKGLKAMFMMMNASRIGVGIQGLAVSERAYQAAVAYAAERRQGRMIGGDATPVTIINHPDVRRMLTTMRAQVEAMRLLLYATSHAVDMAKRLPDGPEKEAASRMEAFLTPIAKAWPTDLANEVTSLAIQVHGGAGYIEETGVAQHYRDARITAIYEGTNGIQAMDLVGRKLRMDEGEPMLQIVAGMRDVSARLSSLGHEVEAKQLLETADVWSSSARWVVENLATHTLDVFAGASPFLAMSGLAVGGWLMGKQLLAAKSSGTDKGADARVVSASFFLTQLLPEAASLAQAVRAGLDNLLSPEALGVEA